MRVTLDESRPVAQALRLAEGPGRFLVQLITPGWGSSGFYSQEVIEQAAVDRVWPAGTHMYLDHPTESEGYERPERSVRDLSAVLTEDARWDAATAALVAEVRVFSAYRTQLAEMLDTIGVSIRGAAEGEMGEAEGRRGRIITRLIVGESVDFVTHAGRGGKVLAVLESDRRRVHESRNVGQWVESRIHRDFTVTADEMFGDGRLSREERITLSGAIGDALSAFVARIEADAPELYTRDLWDEPPMAAAQAIESAVRRGVGEATVNDRRERLSALVKSAYAGDETWVWVRDFDDTNVWFDIESPETVGTYSQAYTVADDVATALTGERTEVRAVTTYVPVTPAGQSTTTQESQEDPMLQIEEARLRQLEADAGRVTALETERDTAVRERDEATHNLAEHTTREKLRPVVTAIVVASESLPPMIVQRVISEVTSGLQADATEESAKATATAARTTAEAEAAAIAEMFGAGKPRGLGGTTNPPGSGDPVSEADVNKAVARAFGHEIKEA